ncbi:McrB family protein [Paenibacillus sp. FSL R5-0810]|uniref:McrB family protein n=1 Tax=Paenibacillus sp. FSL R5-0810 TaxID=2921659 RepID=UPI0030F7581E
MNKDWNVDFVGLLATEEDLQKRPIIINSQNSLQFFVKLISDTPYGFPNVNLFTFYSSDLVRYGFEDDYYRPDDERKEKLERFLNDYMLIFRPQKRVLPNHNEIYVGKEVRLIRKSDSYVHGTTFIPVPVFSEERHDVSFDDLIHKILNNKFIGRIESISTEANDTPQFVLWKQGDKYSIIGEFDKHQYAHGGYCLNIAGQLKIREFEDDWLEDCYGTPENPTLMFLPLGIYQNMSTYMEAATPLENLDDAASEVSAAVAVDVPEKPVEIQQSEFVPSAQAITMKESTVEGTDALFHMDNEEYRFMDHFIQITRDMGLQYSEKDLFNFHTSMKSNTLNIIAGMSGTGKSRLVQAYARALGLDDDQFVIIPVRPSWTDDSDLIGYVDAMNMVYRPGDSGLINTLIQAQKEENRKSKLYLICFDEMNLARVEHYFSQFLSVLEMDPQRRFLRLYNDDLTGRLYNTAQYEPVITIPENIMFVGTVNIDESTYHFSDKVLDRANVISLDVLPYTGLKYLSQKERKPQGRKTPYTFEEYNKFRQTEGFTLSDREAEFFWTIHQTLQESNKNFGVGPRVVRQIDMYIRNLLENPYISKRDALDIQVVQRILTKLRGPEGLLKELIGRIDASGEVIGSKLLERLDEYKDISDFTETRDVLIQKVKELKINGYTI